VTGSYHYWANFITAQVGTTIGRTTSQGQDLNQSFIQGVATSAGIAA
jgi:hypothetical protein